MQVTTRRLLVLILIAQAVCVTVGLSFHHLYVSSALVHAEEDEARADLSQQIRPLAASVEQQDLAALRQKSAWASLTERWRPNADERDSLYLLDAQGRVVAQVGGTMDAAAKEGSSSAPLKLSRGNVPWGRFGEPIRGLIKTSNGTREVVVAQGLASQDGYLLLARSAEGEKITPAELRGALWVASGITLLWTLMLQAATMFMIMAHFKQGRTREKTNPDIEALKQAQALLRTQETVIFGLAKLSDSRDADTGSHLERIAHYSATLAAGLRQRPEFREQITLGFIQLIGISSALHDIGKVGVEDSILRKPGALTSDERSRMQCHTQIGAECLREIERRLGSSNFLQMAREISSAHHERWDGKGYPFGMAAEDIPLAARIVALADVYDALSCKRVYKQALPHEQCVAMIAEEAGKHFDPRIVEVFLQIEDRFRQISQQFHAADQATIVEEAEAIRPRSEEELAQRDADIDFAVAAAARFADSEVSLLETRRHHS